MSLQKRYPKRFKSQRMSPEMEHKRKLFIQHYKEQGTRRSACLLAGVGRDSIHKWEREIPEFAAAMRQAEHEMTEKLEDSAIQRATSGQSDQLLMFLLKARDRSKYGERIRHDFAIKTLDAVVEEVLKAIQANVPEFCPHCRTNLNVTPAIAKELLAMSATLTGKVEAAHDS